MSTANAGYQAPTVTVASSLPKRAGDAVLILPVVSGQDDDATATVVANPFLDAEAVGEIEVALKALGAKGGTEQVTRVVAPSLPVASVLAIGLGNDRDAWPADVIRRAAGVAARSLNGTESVITTLSDIDLEAAVEGLILGAYRFNDFRSDKTAPKDKGLREITALTADTKAKTKAAAERATAIATAVATARDLVNTPPSHLYPAEFAKRAKALGEATGLEVEVLDDKALAKEGYGGVIGVGKGSSRPPRLVRLTHRGAKNKKAKKVALVGKGITFDTGGISIKPAANMHHMTSDMGGAAAVIATVVLAARQQLPIDVIATVPMAENMPSSTAQRPGDVLTQYGGITVEVLNTDAEGRLILADAIVRACEDKPDYLIETSTLTGAQTVALGARTPGVMGSDEFRDRVATISQSVGENGWPMPLPEELKDDLKSTVADLANVSGSRYAGMLVAGTYLREFVADGV
ncbi:MAG: leucyl aminopeptidase, partial [Mycobacterium sp.]|nr:leucyl aminopeptidase [Mycobacterium sp.]